MHVQKRWPEKAIASAVGSPLGAPSFHQRLMSQEVLSGGGRLCCLGPGGGFPSMIAHHGAEAFKSQEWTKTRGKDWTWSSNFEFNGCERAATSRKAPHDWFKTHRTAVRFV